MEQTLNTPLSGAEIIEALRTQLTEKLRRDCYLNPNHAYDWFTAHIKIDITLHDAGQYLETEHKLDYEKKIKPPEEKLEVVDETLEVEKQSPNEVRVGTDQPVPVLTKDKDGRSLIEGIKYGRKSLLEV